MSDTQQNHKPDSVVLSVIVPLNNAEKYLSECLDSLFAQNAARDSFEVICVDDGSTDGSEALLGEYSKRHGNLIVLRQQNKGVSAARNAGLRRASGRYVWFVDSDDYISADAFEVLFPLIDEGEYDRIRFEIYRTSASYKDCISNKSAEDNELLITDAPVFCHIYKRSFLRENDFWFREGIAAGEDSLFNFELGKLAPKQKQLDVPLCYYRKNEGSVTRSNGNKEKLLCGHISCLEIIKGYYDSEQQKELKTIRLIHCELEYSMLLMSLLAYGDRKEYIRRLIKEKLFPYMRLFSQGLKLSLYTDLYSFFLNMICLISESLLFSWVIRLWSSIRDSKASRTMEGGIKALIIGSRRK